MHITTELLLDQAISGAQALDPALASNASLSSGIAQICNE